MFKKPIISLIVLLALVVAILGIYMIGSPEVVIVNQSNQNVNEVVVKLPSNRIVFGAISPKSESRIFYSWSQAKGHYEYQVSITGGSNQTGKCGKVTQHEFGKRLTLIIHADLAITCHETSKV